MTYVECQQCKLRTRNYWTDGYYGSVESEKDAVETWNRRIPVMPNETALCANCKYYAEFEGVCTNNESDNCADFTDMNDYCGCFEESKKYINAELAKNIHCTECGKEMIIKDNDIECYDEEDYIYYSGQYFCCDKCINDYYNV